MVTCEDKDKNNQALKTLRLKMTQANCGEEKSVGDYYHGVNLEFRDRKDVC